LSGRGIESWIIFFSHGESGDGGGNSGAGGDAVTRAGGGEYSGDGGVARLIRTVIATAARAIAISTQSRIFMASLDHSIVGVDFNPRPIDRRQGRSEWDLTCRRGHAPRIL
jgi:hypothetical protein